MNTFLFGTKRHLEANAGTDVCGNPSGKVDNEAVSNGRCKTI